jgi:hypothetical protein
MVRRETGAARGNHQRAVRGVDSACKVSQPASERDDVQLSRRAGKQLGLVLWNLCGNTRRSSQTGADDLAPVDRDLSAAQSEGDVLVVGRRLHRAVSRPDVYVHVLERTAARAE